jgi:uncharacterized protein YbjT (DUF2867 family)
VARALIVGCGCRGRELGAELRGRGWQVRGTSRAEAGLEAIEQAGIEPALADPDRPGTILDLCGDVAALVWLLASASGDPQQLAAIHGSRLERLLEKLVDSPVRGFVYETGPDAAGAEIVKRAGETWRIRVGFLGGEASPLEGAEAIEALLS